ncbi:hypothetical protein Bhz60_00074 [Stenotrophomonas phage vB_SmaS_Bhz60]
MTTRVRLQYVHGNKALAVAVEGHSAGELGPGRSIEIDLHSGMQLTVDETGEFFGHQQPEAQQPQATVDEATTDASAFENRRDLPPGAGEPGSNVPDTRVE